MVTATSGSRDRVMRPLKQTVGWIVLATYLAAYLGLLVIGERAVLAAILGFVLTVVAGLVTAPRRQRWAGVPGAPGAWAPFRIGAPLFAIALGLLAAFYLVALLSGGRGISDVGSVGLLLPRAHYTLSSDGVQSEVERWRFVVVGLLFYSLWFAGGAVAAWLVFFKRAPGSPRPTA